MEKSKFQTLMSKLTNEYLHGNMTSESVGEFVNHLRPMIESEQFNKSMAFIKALMKEHTKDGKLDVDSFKADLKNRIDSKQ